jgi:hypothetical protein
MHINYSKTKVIIKYWFSFFTRGIEVSDAEALVTMSMIISESKNAPLLLFSGVDVRDFTATLVLKYWRVEIRHQNLLLVQ